MKNAENANKSKGFAFGFRTPNSVKNMKLGVKFALMAAVGVLVTAVALIFQALGQSGRYNDLAQDEVETLIDADLDHITQGVLNLVKTENEAVQSSVDAHLNVARHVLASAGLVTLSEENVSWSALNQFTEKVSDHDLPRLLVGGVWLGQNADLSVKTPVVDDVTHMIGETTTIFQRMNPAGDMLRVATTVETLDKKRAIGTYIPAVNPDGTDNVVVSAILRGKAYHGRAYVVNSWYLTAYEPLRDVSGELAGMLYVGVKQKAVESRIRNAILNTKVGKTGYVYVIGGTGNERGRYIISQDGVRDGEDIWTSQDSDGRYVIQEIVRQAKALNPGEMTTYRYRWQNPGESAPRWKIARLAYYEPWDWIIGTSVYEDELQCYHTMLTDGRLLMMRDMTVAGVIIAFLVVLVNVLLTFRISQPIRQMTLAARKISAGDLNQVVEVHSHDDIGILACAFNLMTQKLIGSMKDLKESEEKYRLIFEDATEGLFQTSLAGAVISANPAMAKVIGYASPEELIADVTDLAHQIYVNAKDRERVLSILALEGSVVGFEVKFRRKDGVETWVSISAHFVFDETGSPYLIEGFISDINDRKKAEEALAESRNFLDEIFNAVGDPMLVKNQQHQWVLVNDAMCAFIGQTREELLGKCAYDFLCEEEADVFRANDDAVLSSGEEEIMESVLTDSNGTVHSIMTKNALYTDKTGEKYVVAIIRDVTRQKAVEKERRELEERLGQSHKMEAIGTLAGGIAHDFNNILSAIIGYTELAREDASAPEAVRDSLGLVLNSSMRARDLVKQILTFSRKTEAEYSPLELRNVVNESLKMLRSVIPSTVEIRQQLTASGQVMSDPTQLHQIVMNLCTNAVHAMQSGGVLSVSLTESAFDVPVVLNGFSLEAGSYLNLTVQDTGMGIPKEILDRIFEPYFTTKEQGRGSGMGLSVVHGIVKNHGGAIVCRSVLGKGTAFSVYLPLVESVLEDARPVELAMQPGGTERILFVDDEALLATLAERMLQAIGYQVVSSSDSIGALELFRKSPEDFDLVITDMTMPKMTGDRLAQEMIAIRRDIPVILCSGFSEQITDERIEELGIRAFYLKPLDIRSLAEVVRHVLDQQYKGT